MNDNKCFTDLLEEVMSAKEVYQPSPFWAELAEVSLKQLQNGGYENFKRTVNMKYFNWDVLGIMRHQFLPVFWRWLKHPDKEVFRTMFPNYWKQNNGNIGGFNLVSAQLYKVYVAMLWCYVADQDRLGILESLDEPEIGNPYLIHFRRHLISQDLCNSVHEFYSSRGDLASDGRQLTVAELGAGYGRLAYVYLKALPSASYCIIDIPPALNIAQRYLSSVFPEDKLFRFRRFKNYAEVQQEFESSRIKLLASNQIELLPPKHFDLFINISSLHEMTLRQIENYISQINRVCRGLFYTKQWRVSRAISNGFVIRESEYPIPGSWVSVYHRQHPLQRMFFEALYQIK